MTTQCDPREMEARRIAEGRAEVARMEAAGDVASLARVARQVAPLVALAEVFGWDGVENSEHLAEFLRERLVRATVDRHARQGLEAREEAVRQALTEAGVPAGVERAPGITSHFADDRVRWLSALTWELTAEGSRYAVLVEQMAMAVQAGVERDAVDRGATREQLVDMGHEYSRAIQERDAATRQVAEVNTALDDLFAKVVEEMRARDRQMDALRAEAEQAGAESKALHQVAAMRCTLSMAGKPGWYADCREEWRDAMGGTVPEPEQRERWCPRCVAVDAVERAGSDSSSAQAPDYDHQALRTDIRAIQRHVTGTPEQDALNRVCAVAQRVLMTQPAPAQAAATGRWLPSTCGVLHYYVGDLTPVDARAECGSPAVLALGGPHQGVCERCRFETGTTPPAGPGVPS